MPLGDHEAKKCRHIVHHESSRRQPADQRQVHLDEVARTMSQSTETPMMTPTCARSSSGNARDGCAARRPGSRESRRTPRSRRRRPRIPPVADRLFGPRPRPRDGQMPRRAVEPLAQQRRQESLETAGPADLEAVQLNVGEHSDRDALAAALADALAVVEDPAHRARIAPARSVSAPDECTTSSITSMSASVGRVSRVVRRPSP